MEIEKILFSLILFSFLSHKVPSEVIKTIGIEHEIAKPKVVVLK